MKKIILAALLPFLAMAQIKYPETKKVDQTDNYFGENVADPYRWLEDDRSAETGAWVKAQNEVTSAFLDKIPFRKQFRDRLEKIYNYPKYSAPIKKGDWYYVYKNNGLQNQSVLYRQKGLNGALELVLDPNKLSPDGTTRLMSFNLSKNGQHAAYALSNGGSDWQEIKIMDMQSLKTLADKLEWVKVSGIAWQGNGFYYSRYPQPDGSALAAKNENHQVFFHKINTAQSLDELIYEDKANPQRFHIVQTSEDEKVALLSLSDRSKGLDGNALMYKIPGQKSFSAIKEEITNNSFSFIDNVKGKYIIQTNEDAPNEKLVLFDPVAKTWAPFISEQAEPLQGAATAGGKLFMSYLKDVSTQIKVFNLDGTLENNVSLPGLGTAQGFGGETKDSFVFYTFTSFTEPANIFKYDIASKKSSIFKKSEVDFNSADFETIQVFYPSKDGTKIPMYITHKKVIELNGQNPTILYGYGGFNVSLNPSFSSILIPFLEQGGVYAQANLRGGSEYGEKWHEQGMKLKKQNVFDDFIAAGEYLIAKKYCDSQHLALRGGSNGGLLVGAVINQRPDLAKVAIPQVGVMDMLRFQKFTIGWNWIADYGSAENKEEYPVLRSYSPIHNIKSGVSYPATLITTADHDDRVVPAHSFKYAAVLQEVAGKSSTNPLLIKIDTNSGHGASNTKKNLDSAADIYSFIFYNMGLRFK